MGYKPGYGMSSNYLFPHYPTSYPSYGDSRGSGDKGKKKENLGGMLLGAAGGLAVGALAGAVLSHEIRKYHCCRCATAAPCRDY